MTTDKSRLTLVLDEEDTALIDDLVRREKLSRSDILRRGLRFYAREAGIVADSPALAPTVSKSA